MVFPLRPFLDPAHQQGFLAGTESQVAFRRRHDHFGVFREDAAYQFTLCRGTGYHGGASGLRELGVQPVFLVQAQPRLPALLVGPVAGVAAVAQDGPDVLVEIHVGRQLLQFQRNGIGYGGAAG